MATAARLGLLACHACALVSRPAAAGAPARCPRCDAHLHHRKPNSIGRTWAFLIAAYILYVPANLLPIMDTESLFDSQRNTIMSVRGKWPAALGHGLSSTPSGIPS